MTAPLELAFAEGGEILGVVTCTHGELSGPSALQSLVRNRMQRNGMDAETAVVSLHGWSNGSLSSRLIQHD